MMGGTGNAWSGTIGTIATAAAVACSPGQPAPSTAPGTPPRAEATIYASGAEEAADGVLRTVSSGAGGLRPRVLHLLERCGLGPAGQQGLLLLAAAELDPRNPDGSPTLALAAARLLLRATPEESWVRPLAATLYGLAAQLGAETRNAGSADPGELLSHLSLAETTGVETRACGPEPWPSDGASVDSPLPVIAGPSYPDQVRMLKQRIAALEAELRRLRRLTKQP